MTHYENLADFLAEAYAKAQAECTLGLHDYSSYPGDVPPHVVRDYSIRKGSDWIFASHDAAEAREFFDREKRKRSGSAALTALCTLRPDIAKILDGTAVAVDKHDAQVVKNYWSMGQTIAECGCDTPILCGDEGRCVAAR